MIRLTADSAASRWPAGREQSIALPRAAERHWPANTSFSRGQYCSVITVTTLAAQCIVIGPVCVCLFVGLLRW